MKAKTTITVSIKLTREESQTLCHIISVYGQQASNSDDAKKFCTEYLDTITVATGKAFGTPTK